MKSKLMVALAATTVIAVGLGAGSFAWFTSTAASTNNAFKTGTLSVSDSTYDNDDWGANWTAKPDGTGAITLGASLGNLQCGDSKMYTFTVTNGSSSLDLLYKSIFSDLMNSSGDVIITDSTGAAHTLSTVNDANLLNAVQFDLTIDRIAANDTGFVQSDETDQNKGSVTAELNDYQITAPNLNLNTLKSKLATVRKMAGDSSISDKYTIVVTLPRNIFTGTSSSTSGLAKIKASELASRDTANFEGTLQSDDNLYQGTVGAFQIKSVAAQNVTGALFDNADADNTVTAQ